MIVCVRLPRDRALRALACSSIAALARELSTAWEARCDEPIGRDVGPEWAPLPARYGRALTLAALQARGFLQSCLDGEIAVFEVSREGGRS